MQFENRMLVAMGLIGVMLGVLGLFAHAGTAHTVLGLLVFATGCALVWLGKGSRRALGVARGHP
jgi:hypothetical protein